MFKTILHNHTRTDVDPVTGVQTDVKVACDEFNQYVRSHVNETISVGSDGKAKTVYAVVSCMDAELELTQRRADNLRLKTELGSLQTEVSSLKVERDNCQRLMSGAIQVIFGMGPALQGLLSDDLGDPALTSDRRAVVLEGVDYSVVIEVFQERIIVSATTGGVLEKTFRLTDGRLNEDQRTLLLGHVTRIKEVAQGNMDPVQSEIDLVSAA